MGNSINRIVKCLQRSVDGPCDIVRVGIEDGRPCTVYHEPLKLIGPTTIVGWGEELDGDAIEYASPWGGWVVIIPVRCLV